ncbi:blue copper oxidase [Methylomarinovum tepidoasis]|uniref:Blue copper oxidase n=1 Tax=Methylomarinovum tepidoasis TaxID=2840183 RepID=A0AAU9CAT6_9GAMM|nr:multicopper oxidase domain-containing protein [Methylomarinovum sp. IN45]BCX89072.1 blue copper oxidase [Methylomarinovum sp. IN45]
MSEKIDLKRRRLLQAASAGMALAAAGPAFPIILKRQSFGRPKREATATFFPDVEIELVAAPGKVQILPGPATRVWRYTARVVKGDPDAVIPIPDTYLGPILKFRKGQRVRITLHNRLPAKFITHWHGMHVPFEADGHPSYAIDPEETYVYEFTVENRAGTYWYHPHTNMVTGAQAYSGLAGLILVEDDEENEVPLPRGEYDLPLVLQDRTFDETNQLLYDRRGPIAMLGFLGEKILVNGHPDFTLNVASRSYRFRVLNGSNSRIYKLAWSDGDSITVIGTDGGLLERPVTRPYLMIGPGERYELWRDFSKSKGKEVRLESQEYHGIMPPLYERFRRSGGSMMGMGGMMGGGMGRGGRMGSMGQRGGMGGMMGTQTISGPEGMMGTIGPMMLMARHIPQGSHFTIARFRVTEKPRTLDNQELPAKLRPLPQLSLDDVVNPDKPRPIAIGNHGRQFTLNGQAFSMTGALPIETFPVNTIHLMEIFHEHGGMEMEGEHGGESEHGSRQSMQGMGGGMSMAMMMAMVHPIHLHGHYFQIVRRTPPEAGGMHGSSEGYETVKDGLVDEGYQDTVLAMAGERIQLIKPFDKYKGLFLYHCHNLEHEDGEMMRNFKVV